MPTTSVPNNSGTIKDLIMRRKTVDRICRSVASNPLCAGLSGKSHPTSTPTIIEITIHCVCVIRRRPVRGGVGAAAVFSSADIWSGGGGRCVFLAQLRVPVSVHKVEHETNQQPPAEA